MRSDFIIALHVVGFLTAAEGAPLSSEILAKTYGTSPVVVRRILVKLNEGGIVISKRGVGGGTILAKDSADISLRQIHHAVEGDSAILPRYPSDEKAPSIVLSGYLNRLLVSAEEELLEKLANISVSELDQHARPAIYKILKGAKGVKCLTE